MGFKWSLVRIQSPRFKNWRNLTDFAIFFLLPSFSIPRYPIFLGHFSAKNCHFLTNFAANFRPLANFRPTFSSGNLTICKACFAHARWAFFISGRSAMRMRRSKVDRIPQSDIDVLRACEAAIKDYPPECQERTKIEEQISELKRRIERNT